MSDASQKRILPRTVVAGALALGLIGGGYGIASAANDSSPATAAPAASTTDATAALSALTAAPTAQQGFGGQRSDETPLTGDALARVTKAATAKVPGGTIDRVESDADGNAAYEAHMTAADGSRTTVYVDKSFNVVSVDTR